MRYRRTQILHLKSMPDKAAGKSLPKFSGAGDELSEAVSKYNLNVSLF